MWSAGDGVMVENFWHLAADAPDRVAVVDAEERTITQALEVFLAIQQIGLYLTPINYHLARDRLHPPGLRGAGSHCPRAVRRRVSPRGRGNWLPG